MIFVNFYESVTDGRTDGPTDRPGYRDARTHLKTVFLQLNHTISVILPTDRLTDKHQMPSYTSGPDYPSLASVVAFAVAVGASDYFAAFA